MSFESLMGVSQRLSISVEALAALGAQLRFLENGLDGDPRVRALVNDVARAIDPQLLEGVERNQQAAVLALIRTMFRQGLDLLENPERASGWSYQDPDILQSQGQPSRLLVQWIEAVAAQRPELNEVLRQPGAFLDVGTGVGSIAIEAARSWPALRVVGIDPWEPALALARKNLALSGLVERVELRLQRAEQLEETATFTLAWVPGPFISPEVIDRALEHVRCALVPGGWLIFGFYPVPSAPLEQALSRLRIVRSGGHPWTSKEVEGKLRALAFEQIEVYSPAPLIVLVVAQRPNSERAGRSCERMPTATTAKSVRMKPPGSHGNEDHGTATTSSVAKPL
jgi:ubiquinone/menaquinone biosynthesis C-methylase UbiE